MMLGLATATMVESTRIMKKPTIMAHSAFHGFAGPRGGSAKLTSGAGPAMLLVIVSTPRLGLLAMKFGFPRATPSSALGVPADCRLQPRCQTETIDSAVPGAMPVARNRSGSGPGVG